MPSNGKRLFCGEHLASRHPKVYIVPWLFLPRALVAQLAPFGVSKGDIQGSNPPFRVVTIELLNKGNDN